MTGHLEVRLSGTVPPPSTVARRLWFDGVRDPELLVVADRWRTLDAAWDHCARVELVLPLAILRRRPMVDVARVARSFIVTAREHLGPLGWPREDLELGRDALAEALAPDVDVVRVTQLRDLALERAGRKADGWHRYRLLTAIAHAANLGVRRVGARFGACADAELVTMHLIGALEEASATQQGDLFAEPVDLDEWHCGCLLGGMEALA